MCKIITDLSLDGKLNNKLWDIPEYQQYLKQTIADSIIVLDAQLWQDIPIELLTNKTIYVMYKEDDAGFKKLDSMDILEMHHVTKFYEREVDKDSVIHYFMTADEIISDIYEKNQGKTTYILGGIEAFTEFLGRSSHCHITWINNMYPGVGVEFPIEKLFENYEMIDDTGYQDSINGLKFKKCVYKNNNVE